MISQGKTSMNGLENPVLPGLFRIAKINCCILTQILCPDAIIKTKVFVYLHAHLKNKFNPNEPD